MHATLKQKVTRDAFGRIRATGAPSADYMDIFRKIMPAVGLKPATIPAALAAAIRAEDEIKSAFPESIHDTVSAEWDRVRNTHIVGVASGQMPVTAKLTVSRQTIEDEVRRTVAALGEALELRIAKSRPLLREFVETLIPPIRQVRETAEQREIREANDLGIEFVPSPTLRALAGVEQHLEIFLLQLDQISAQNPTRSLLKHYLPAGLVAE